MTITTCERLKTQLASAPESGAALPKGLAEHAATCPTCMAELTRASALVAGLEGLGQGFAPAGDVVAQAIARAESPRTSARRPWGFIAGGLVGAAAAAAVAVALSGPSGPSRPSTGEPAAHLIQQDPARIDPKVAPPEPVAHVDVGLSVKACLDASGEVSCDVGRAITTDIGETKAFRLSDGTLLNLDQDTVVRLDPDARALTIERGEAFFDVVKHPEMEALRITMPTGDVEVLGTALEIRAGESLSVVDVVRGVVAAKGAGSEKRVRAGQAAWLAAGKGPVVRASSGSAGPEGWSAKSDASAPGYANVGFGSIRARRPGAATDTDTPLVLVDHMVTTRIQGMMAKTTVEESFRSDEGHELEGTYRFTLPAGAQVAELSLLVGDRWEEGAFVSRDRADKIWAGVIRNATPVIKRREIIEYIWVPGPWRDPALLSWKQGNTFELRIFPIPARGERRVRIAYTERLPLVTGGRRYTLPLPADKNAVRAERFALDLQVGGLGERETRDVRVRNYELTRETMAGGVRLAAERRGFRPSGDLVVDVPDADAVAELTGLGFTPASSDDAYVAFTLRPDFSDANRPRPESHEAGSGLGLPADSWRSEGFAKPQQTIAGGEPTPLDVAIIVDTSYGIQKLRLERAGELAREIVSGLGKGDTVHVLACATRCSTIIKGEPADADLAARVQSRLSKLEPMGSSRLGFAFAEAQKTVAAAGDKARIIYLGDGVASTGELDARRLASDIRQAIGDVRVTSVALGGETDDVFLGALGRDHASSFLDVAAIGSVDATARKVLARQHGEPLRAARLALPEGVERVAPSDLGDLWPGEEQVVTGRVRRGAQDDAVLDGEVVLSGRLAGEPVDRKWQLSVALGGRAGNAFVPRLWAEARIAELSKKDDPQTIADIVAISETHHVLSRHTSLLVLESPAMAKAFGVQAKRGVADWSGEDVASGDTGTDLGGTLQALGDENQESELASLEDNVRAGASGKGAATKTTAEYYEAKKPDAKPMAPARGMDFDMDGWGRGGGGGGGWVAMKKVWYKEASVRDHGSPTTWEERQLDQRESRWDEEPNSRERTLSLVRWHLRMGHVDEAERMTQRWLERDRMDAEALVTLADIAALRGDMPRAEGWLASAIDVDHRSSALHARLADAYLADGDAALACEHRLARALVMKNDMQAQVDAVRCGASESRVLDALDDAMRTRVERALRRDASPSRLSGPFKLEATWSGREGAPVDLDLLVVSPSGRVVSRLGGAVGTGLTLVVGDATSDQREALTFKGSESGRWQIFAVRHGEVDEAPSHVVGTLKITAHGTTRRVAFTIGDEQVAAPIADIDVATKFRYERAN